MKALIFNNKVVDVQEAEFPVHNSMTWVDCGNDVTTSFSYSDGVFTAPPSEWVHTYDLIRQREYPKVGDVIDAIFKKEAGDSTEWDTMVTERQSIKDANPKD